MTYPGYDHVQTAYFALAEGADTGADFRPRSRFEASRDASLLLSRESASLADLQL